MKTLNLNCIPCIEEMKPYLDLVDYESYHYNISTILMWNHECHLQYEIFDHYMIMLNCYKGHYFWMMPCCTPDYYHEAMLTMKQYSQELGFEFAIDCAEESFVNFMKETYQDQYIYQRTDSEDDYIYSRSMLETLSGKKMQKRRNHYNSFIKEYPQFIYKELDPIEDYGEIVACLSLWESDKGELDYSLSSEIKGIFQLISEHEYVNLRIGGIYIDSHLEAFIIASNIDEETLQIHVEKANKEIRGLYPAILKCLLERESKDIKWINREEDMGLENLRKAKMALHPDHKIHKYSVLEAHLVTRQAQDGDLEQIKDLWLANFSDETRESTDYYFTQLYKTRETYVIERQGCILCMLQIKPIIINKNKSEVNAFFIEGVATRVDFQKQGLMKSLMTYVLDLYQDQNLYLQAYVPQIYQQFGFYPTHYLKKVSISRYDLITQEYFDLSNDLSLLSEYYNRYIQNYNLSRIRDDNYWKNYMKQVYLFNQNVVIFNQLGYLKYEETETHFIILEAIYLNETALEMMLNYFADTDKDLILYTDSRCQLVDEGEFVVQMLSRQNEDSAHIINNYMNEIY